MLGSTATRSPGLIVVTSSATASTVPAYSWPGTSGKAPSPYRPCSTSISVWHRPAARTRTRACPGRTVGVSSSAMPARPAAANRMAFIPVSSKAVRQAPSAHPVAAIDIIGVRQDVVAVGRGKEHGEPGDVLRRGETADRHRLRHLRLLLCRLQALPSGEMGIDVVPMLAVDDAKGNGVYFDAVLDERQSRRLLGREDRRLGGAVNHQ